MHTVAYYILFNVFSENIFKEALENVKNRINVNGEVIKGIRYADDAVLVADTDLGLQ